MERAVDWSISHANETLAKIAGHTSSPARYQLQSVVMHKGSSLHAGHYVAFIRKENPDFGEDWVLFNDEKVVRGGDWNEVYKTGYVYFFRRSP